MVWSRMDSEISYSPNLEAAFKLILEDPAISGSLERPSLIFIRAARFLKRNAPHLFQIRDPHTAPLVYEEQSGWRIRQPECS